MTTKEFVSSLLNRLLDLQILYAAGQYIMRTYLIPAEVYEEKKKALLEYPFINLVNGNENEMCIYLDGNGQFNLIKEEE